MRGVSRERVLRVLSSQILGETDGVHVRAHVEGRLFTHDTFSLHLRLDLEGNTRFLLVVIDKNRRIKALTVVSIDGPRAQVEGYLVLLLLVATHT